MDECERCDSRGRATANAGCGRPPRRISTWSRARSRHAGGRGGHVARPGSRNSSRRGRLEGNWIASRDDETQCLIGPQRGAAIRISRRAADSNLSYLGRKRAAYASRASSIPGGAEDNQVFVNLARGADTRRTAGQNRTRAIERERKLGEHWRLMPRGWRRRFRPRMTCGRSGK